MSAADSGTNIDPRWAKLQALFSQALDLPEDQRRAFVLRESGDDSQLFEEVMDLLAEDSRDSAGRVLTNALGAAIDATTRERRNALIGRVLGNYRLTAVIGQGGTGTVYLAERSDRQYSAQVAIKVVDSATLRGDLSLRFRAERQILASLSHPNIARLIDAGETHEGQPYLVMEYVHGETLDRYCDRRQLDLTERLKLFLQICSAVQYAHQNLVVHRDLKPANILVTADGSPKLLDFGIAKLLDTGEMGATLALTRMNDRLLTPEYASPEQILGRAVTTASDVYALGVVLYELVTGFRPFTVSASASQLELERSICVADPLRPSATIRRAIQIGETELSALADARAITAERLERKLAGDIDAICMRAMRKEIESRYASVEQLAADVRRYLAREPVLARQGNWLYYSQRFVRRHTFGVAASASFVVFTIAFGIAMSIQAQRISEQRDRAAQESTRAEAVSDFMLDVFAASEPFTNQGREISARELLDEAARTIKGDLNQHPEVRARLLEAMGIAYRRQNQFERAIAFLEEALHVRRQMPAAGGSKTGAVLVELAAALRQTGDIEGANSALQQALQISRKYREERTPAYANLLTNLGRVELLAGNATAARKHFNESLALYRALTGPNSREVASLFLELSTVSLWIDDLAAAEQTARAGVDIYRIVLPELHPDRVLAEARLAEVLAELNRVDEAAPLLERSLEAQRRLYGDRSRQVADTLDSLAHVRKSQGLLREAESYARQAVEIQVETLGEQHVNTAYFRTKLATVLMRRKKFSEAESELRRSLETYATALPPDHQYVASSEHVLGELLLETGRLSDAEAVLTASMNRWRRTDAPPWRAARSASALGEVLYRQGRTVDAERYLVEGYLTVAADPEADRDAKARSRERVVNFYTNRGQRARLEELLVEASAAQQAQR